MSRVVAMALCLACWGAQATERVTAERLLALVMAIESAKRADERDRIRQLRLVDAHAARIQAWHGQHRQTIIPGTGWYKVHKNDGSQ